MLADGNKERVGWLRVGENPHTTHPIPPPFRGIFGMTPPIMSFAAFVSAVTRVSLLLNFAWERVCVCALFALLLIGERRAIPRNGDASRNSSSCVEFA
jgi:hypothetical protein